MIIRTGTHATLDAISGLAEAQPLTHIEADEGIDLVMNAQVKRVSGKSGQAVQVVIEQKNVEHKLEGSHLLVATGRTPNTADIGLDLAGVELTDRGYIKVNERLETTEQNVWALGEVAGSPQFTGSVQIAIIAGLPYTALREAVLTHPTLIEGLNFLFDIVPSAPSQRKIA